MAETAAEKKLRLANEALVAKQERIQRESAEKASLQEAKDQAATNGVKLGKNF